MIFGKFHKNPLIMYKSTFSLLVLLIFSLSTFNSSAQEKIIDSYENFTEAPREIAYAHLNKSTYIEGEMLGFTAYVFDKFTKQPSSQTSNLYCTISNLNGDVLKKKLIKVNNGVASNVFDVDSTLSNGVFTFKAYTNWMRNFDEQNHYEQTFKVINPENTTEIIPFDPANTEVDLQVLGEGGHIVYNTPNTIGIVAKNQFGYGIANAFGTLVDNDGKLISEFQLNDVGLAKLLFIPNPEKNYKVNLKLKSKTVSTQIKNIKKYGFTVSLKDIDDKVALSLNSNEATKSQLSNKTFKVALHNGSDLIVSPFEFKNDGSVVLSFLKTNLFEGINIFTIFSEDNKPIAERLFFNSSNLLIQNNPTALITQEKDSISVTLNFDDFKNSEASNLSVSILPSETKSYNHNNTIISQTFIQPYVKGHIQNGYSYFSDNTPKTKFNLDLLMLTQGWSSYSWNDIFDNSDRSYIYPFEKGIDIVANVNNDKSGSYIVYPIEKNNTQVFNVNNQNREFTIKESYPNEDDLFRIGYLDTKKKNFNEKPSVYLQFYPSEFPLYNFDIKNNIQETYSKDEKIIKLSTSLTAWDNSKVNQLDEVVIKTKKETLYTKIEKLREKATKARFRVIDDITKYRNMRVDTYLRQLGYNTFFNIRTGQITITNPRIRDKDPVPLVYLDNALLTTTGLRSDFGILSFITMDMVDYIEYEPYGIGGGIRGGAGYIKIFTDPNGGPVNKANNVRTYSLPMLFSKSRKFYTPKYQLYNTNFFKEYGVIDWKPNLKLNESGNVKFKIPDTKSDTITLFIEGYINNQLISQQTTVTTETGN